MTTMTVGAVKRMGMVLLGVGAVMARPGGLPAQEATLGALDPYLMDHTYEVALARSAAPASVSGRARVLVLGPGGYEVAEEGSNGFTCLVQRSWASPFPTRVPFFTPAVRAPICLNPAASDAALQEYLRRTELALAGRTKAEIRRAVSADMASGALRPPEGMAMAYMLSEGQSLDEKGSRFFPHLMFYVPGATAESVGASAENGRALVFEYPGEPFATLVVPVGAWEAAPVEPHHR